MTPAAQAAPVAPGSQWAPVNLGLWLPLHLLASVVPGNSHSSSHFLSSRLPECSHEHRPSTHRGIGNFPWPLQTQAPSLPCASQLPRLRSASVMPGSQSVAMNPGSRWAPENCGARSSSRPVTMDASFQATSAPEQLPQSQVSGPPQCQISPTNQEFRLALLVPDSQSAPSPGHLLTFQPWAGSHRPKCRPAPGPDCPLQIQPPGHPLRPQVTGLHLIICKRKCRTFFSQIIWLYN